MSKKLLLADDSITIQKVIQITFAHEDYELTITDNGDAAFAKALEIKPDLIMSDVYMPGKNGYELTSAIKQEPTLQHVPVLLLAGSFEPFDEDKARSCKADAWIEKPFESQSLIDKVAELLSAAKSAPEVPAAFTAPAAAVAIEPVDVAEAIVDDPFMNAFDEADAAEPEMMAADEDPFGDISFEDESPPVATAALPADDDWSDFAAEPETHETVATEAFTFAEIPVAEVAEDFTFVDEVSTDSVGSASVEEVPATGNDFDVFDMDEDEIMPLDDDDILGAEDLEPVMPEQTLAAWSRDEAADEDIFVESLEEVSAEDLESAFAPAVEPASAPVTPAFAAEESAFATEEPSFEPEEPSFEPEEPAFVSAPFAFEEPAEEVVPAAQPAAMFLDEASAEVSAVVDVEAKASAMTEAEIERIVEKVVTKVVENLAGSILERVAWEVVPDLAESLIREEIRKIKDAVA
jgi:CheY-like chemotaxis protein